MKQTRIIPDHIVMAIKVRGNLAYETACRVNRSPRNTNDREVYKEVFAQRIRAYLSVISDGAMFEIQRLRG
jgi:hypothetical protein